MKSIVSYAFKSLIVMLSKQVSLSKSTKDIIWMALIGGVLGVIVNFYSDRGVGCDNDDMNVFSLKLTLKGIEIV